MSRVSRAVLLLIVLLGFGLRLHAIDEVALRWDEGWSIALALLPVAEIFRLTALDVHPPLYYLSLKPWLLGFDAPEAWIRFPSAIAATLAIPLAAAAAASWWRPAGIAARRAGILAAACAAVAPPFLYYAGVTRMYAATAPFLLAAVLGLARYAAGGERRWAALAIVGAAGALHSFYYTGFALAGLFLAALLVWPRRAVRTVTVGLISAALFVPWAAYAGPQMLSRTGERTGDAGFDLAAVWNLLDDGLFAATFTHDAGWWPMLLAVGMLVLGAALARPRLPVRLSVIVLPVLATLVGAALGAQAHMFAPRYVIGATPFLVLGVGWALAGLWSRRAVFAAVGAVVLVIAVTPTLRGEVFSRESEVTGAYDPAADARGMLDHAGPDDLVVFNILSLAGAYERHGGPDAPEWTYGQVWDPVREDADLAVQRVVHAVADHPRLWLVLYRGTASPGSETLKRWADETLYPAEGWWTDDRLYQSYVVAIADEELFRVFRLGSDPAVDGELQSHGSSNRVASLNNVHFTSAIGPGEGVGVELGWSATGTARSEGKVFVHLYDVYGNLVAQHDGFAASGTRPASTWVSDETVSDRHGLMPPADALGPFTLVVGLYDPDTGKRWVQADGSDSIELGTVERVERVEQVEQAD